MTRKEQIEQMAIASGYTSTYDRSRLCEGAMWADANPPHEILWDGIHVHEVEPSRSQLAAVASERDALKEKLDNLLNEIEQEIGVLRMFDNTEHGLGQLAAWEHIRRGLIELWNGPITRNWYREATGQAPAAPGDEK